MKEEIFLELRDDGISYEVIQALDPSFEESGIVVGYVLSDTEVDDLREIFNVIIL